MRLERKKGVSEYFTKKALCAFLVFLLCGFHLVFANWPSEIKIEASDGGFGNDFGHSVSINEHICAIGAHSDHSRRGAVRYKNSSVLK